MPAVRNNKELTEIIDYIDEKIFPHTLSEIGKSNIALLLNDFSLDELYRAVDIGFKRYIKLDKNDEPTRESVNEFLDKIGGIAHNNSLSPIEQKIRHIKNICNKKFSYWNDVMGSAILNKYIKALRNNGWSDEKILDDLNGEAMDETNNCSNWTEWRNLFEGWTDSLKKSEIDNSDSTSNNIVINKKYEIIKEIGSGSFGITYLCLDSRLNKHFVIKEFSCGMLKIEDNQKFFKKFIVEIFCLFDLHHQNIVNIYDYVVNEDKQIGYYIMEYIDGVNILDYLKNNKNKINDVFEQLIDAFVYLEKKKLCHRDIRISNILIDNAGVVKLIDFGFVKDISNSNSINSSTKLIQYPYDWPEELKDKKQKYDVKTDIYFLGKLFEDLLEQLKIKKFTYKKIVNKMIEHSYEKRISSFHELKNEITNKKI